jgi:iron complex outermembrane recepter protein
MLLTPNAGAPWIQTPESSMTYSLHSFAGVGRLRMPFRLIGLALLLTAVGGASTAHAAVTRVAPLAQVAVIGTVRDTAGAPVSNVQVVVSGLNRAALTDDRGAFTFRGLPPGTYHLDFVRIGFVAEHVVVVVPASGANVTVSVTMRVSTVRLANVNVTATPTGADPLNTTQATIQLSGKELQRAVSASLGQTLSNEPGMAVRYNGPLASAPVIRGLTGERVLVLQDGDRAGDLSSSAVDHLNAVDPNSAERIEVIRGPASLLYGNNAIGGVVNVITNDVPTSIPTRLGGFVSGQGETAAPGGVGSAGISLPIGDRVALSARGGIRGFDELRVGGGAQQANTDGTTSNASVGAGYVHGRGTLGIGFRQMNFEYGLPHPDDDEPIRLKGKRQQASFQSTWSTGFAPLSALRIDGGAQWYEHDEIEEDGEIGTRFRLNSQTFNTSARTQFSNVSGAIGVQGLLRQYAPRGEEAFTPPADNENFALFLFQDIPLTRSDEIAHALRLQVGARVDRWSVKTRPSDEEEVERFGEAQSRTFDNVASSIGLSLPLREGISLNANVSRGFRAPTVEELYANGFHAAVGTIDIGNPDLEPEKSTGFDTGIRVQNSRTFAQLGAYYNLIDRYIRPVVDPLVDGTVPVVTFAQDDARLYGFEGQVETHLLRHLIGGVMGDVTRAELRDDSRPLPYVPAARLGGSLRFDNGRLSAGGEARRVFAQERVSGDELDVATDAYTLVNLSTTWLFTVRASMVHSITLRADNLLDEQYRDATSRIKSYAFNPGRNISVVYRLLF